MLPLSATLKPCNKFNRTFEVNVGGPGRRIKRASFVGAETRRIYIDPRDVPEIDYSLLTGRFAPFAKDSIFRHAREGVTTKDAIEYQVKLAGTGIEDSCFEWEVLVGFVEFDQTFCATGKSAPARRVRYDLSIFLPGNTRIIFADDFLDVAKEAGGCNKAYILSFPFDPSMGNGVMQIRTRAWDQQSRAMISFMQIQPSTRRRLGADCWKHQATNDEKEAEEDAKAVAA